MKHLFLICILFSISSYAGTTSLCNGFCHQKSISPENQISSLKAITNEVKQEEDYQELIDATNKPYKLTCTGYRRSDPTIKIQFEQYIGFNSKGLPLGITVIKAKYDHPTIEIRDMGFKSTYQRRKSGDEVYYENHCFLRFNYPQYPAFPERARIRNYQCINDKQEELYRLENLDFSSSGDPNDLKITAYPKPPLADRDESGLIHSYRCTLQNIPIQQVASVFQRYAKRN